MRTRPMGSSRPVGRTALRVVPGRSPKPDYTNADVVVPSLCDVDARTLWDFIDAEYS